MVILYLCFKLKDMATVTLRIDERSKAGKALKNLIDALAGKPETGVEIIEDESPYGSEFIKKIKNAEKEQGRTMTSAEKLWESI
jgi:hypothetical protein